MTISMTNFYDGFKNILSLQYFDSQASDIDTVCANLVENKVRMMLSLGSHLSMLIPPNF